MTVNAPPGDQVALQPDDESGAEPDAATVLVGLVLLAACAMGCALMETMLVPLRWGSVIVPRAVLFAVVSNVGLPVLAWRLRAVAPFAAIPMIVWLIAVLFLSQSRREGDVLLPGGPTGVKYVAYGYLLGGFVAGLVTVLWLSGRFRRVERR